MLSNRPQSKTFRLTNTIADEKEKIQLRKNHYAMQCP